MDPLTPLWGAVGGFAIGLLVYACGTIADWFLDRRRRRATPEENS